MTATQKTRFLLFLSSVAVIGSLGLCYGGFDSICGPGVNENLAIFLILFGGVTFFLSFLMLFFSEQKFASWLRFSKYYLPIAAGVIFLSPAVDSSILGFDKEFMTWALSGIFFFSRLGLFLF